jgi:PST family polysaccharide transporter
MSELNSAAVSAGGDLAHAVRRGTRWAWTAQIASQAISLVVLAVLYRLIAPEEYGLLAAALPAVMLPRMAATLGLSTAVLQERELSQSQLSSLFWYTAVLGLVAAAVTAACGPILAAIYEQPTLAVLCLALAGSSLVAALGNQHLALLERHLKVAEASAVRLVAQVAGGVCGILAARRGAGVWALVAQQYGELAVLAIWAWLLEPWRPGWPGPTSEIRGLITFSSFYSLAQLVGYLAQNLDKILIPALLGPAGERSLGLYSQASALMIKPVYVLTAPLTGVMVSGLAQVREDAPAHRQMTVRFFRLVAVGLFPSALGLWAVAPDVMRVLGGARWSDAGPILAALAPAMIAYGFVNLGTHLLSSAGRAGRLLVGMVLMCLLLIGAGVAGLHVGRAYFGGFTRGDPTVAAALGMAACTTATLVVVWFIPYLNFCLRSAAIAPRDVLPRLWPAARSAVVMALAVFGLRMLPPVHSLAPASRLALLVVAGVAIYSLLARRELMWCWSELIHLRQPAGDIESCTPSEES